MLRVQTLACLALAILIQASLSASAQDETSADGGITETPLALDELTVVASKVPRMLRDVTGTITIHEREDLRFRQVLDLEDLVRYEPALSVSRDATRFGSSGFTIRGIGGNRVTIELDGVPVPDGFRLGSFSNAARDWFPPHLLKRVEILRGPSSALYGSDAIAGVVSMTTMDPLDLIAPRRSSYVSADSGYFSVNDGLHGGLTYAGDRGRNSYLFSGYYRDSAAWDIERGPAGMAPNPQQSRQQHVLGKWVFEGDGTVTRMIVDLGKASSDTDVLTGRGERDLSDFVGFPLIVNTTLLLGDDLQERARVSLEMGHDEGWWGTRQTARLYYLESETRQDTLEERTSTAFGNSTPSRRDRRFTLNERTLGGEVFWNHKRSGENWREDRVFGFEFEYGKNRELRDGRETNLLTGDVSSEVAGEVFPVRDYPVTDTWSSAFYAQSEFVNIDGGWSIIPALRLEYTRIDPRPDAVFMADNPDIQPQRLTEFSTAPKLGVVRHINERSQLFAQYARGFRAPPLQDVNFGLSLTTLNILALPNPDLRSESSDGLEFGYRFADWRGSLNVSAHYTRYDDFIESRVNQGVDPETGFLIFQSVNRSEAVIYGIEVSAGLDLGAHLPALEHWYVNSGFAWTRGEDRERNQPLNSVDPPRWVSRLERQSADGRWRLALVSTLVKRSDRVDQSGEALFESPGYGLLDLIGEIEVSPSARLNLGLFNLTDKRYWKWANVRGRPADDPQLAVLSEAGLNARVGLQISW